MTSIFMIDANNDVWQMLPGGVQILARHHYSQPEARGVLAVSIAAMISILAILSLFIAIGVSLLKSWRTPSEKEDCRHLFIKSHAGIYFICMLLTTLTFTIGFMLSIVWAVQNQITFGAFCTVQAALKQFGNVATALWVFVIAVHTFAVVFLEIKVPNFVFYTVFCGVWFLSALVIVVGPLFFTTERLGPWYGISAQWCWTSDTYASPRFATEYLWMFMTGGVSFVLYSLLFLKLRGYVGSNFKFSFKPRPIDPAVNRVAHQMLWYPVVYTVLVFPIAGCRIYELETAKPSNLDFKMGSAVVFVLSGLVNVILYTFTRNIFPLPTILSKLSFRARSNFHRLSHGNLSLPISVSAQDSGILEKTSSNGSEAMSSRTLSPIHSRPDTAQSDLTVANANPFTDAVVDNVVASPVPSHQRQSDGKLRTFSLVKVNSISSASSSSSRRGTIGPAKDGRTVIKKPHRAVLSDGSWYGSSGTGKGKPVETRSLEV